jgi:hypothetical protein
MKKLLLMVCALAFMASGSFAKGPKTTKVSGWVSNEKCGAKDSQNADCTKKCVGNGSKLVIVSDKDKNVLNVDNPDALKGHEGHHVTVTGKTDNGTLHVDKVEMTKEPKS